MGSEPSLVKRSAISGLSLLSAGWFTSALAQGVYPSQPIKVIVSYPAGGSNDLVARLVGEEMSKELGQRFVIEIDILPALSR